MKHSKRRERQEVVPVWTYDQAKQAVPYLASIMRTVREYRIEAQRYDREAQRLASAPGRPDRSNIIAQQEALRSARQADERFQDALAELHELGIYCLNPVRGEAMVPFAHEEQLAWFVYDMFDEEPFRFWRYHSDELGIRRPITDVRKGTSGNQLVV